MTRGLSWGGRLDRYVVRLFILSYLTALFLLVGLVLIIDMATNLDDYLQADADGNTPTVREVLFLYALKLPFLYLQMSPFVTFVAGLFTVSKLAKANEVVAALSAGVSTRRLFAPIFVCAGFFALGMFAMREWVTGALGRERDLVQDRLVERRARPRYENFWITDRSDRSWRIGSFLLETADEPARIEGLFSVFQEGDRAISVRADSAEWSAAEAGWRLAGSDRAEIGTRELLPSRLEFLAADMFTPEEAELAWKGRENPLELSNAECRALLERDPSNTQYRTLLHYHLTFPLAGVLLLLVGLPFLVSGERGRAVERVALGFFVCVTYFGLDFVFRTLGLQGLLGPIHAAWLPVLLFGSVGVVVFGSMRS